MAITSMQLEQLKLGFYQISYINHIMGRTVLGWEVSKKPTVVLMIEI